MSAQTLISSMEKLIKLHKSLLDLTLKKADIVKKGDMNALNQLIKDEQKHVSAIAMVEKERLAATKAIIPNMESPSVSDCLESVEENDRHKLKAVRDELLESVKKIQETNEHNQQLIFQSLQFVNFSLSLVAPQPESFTYGPPAGHKKTSSQSSGMFSSKA